MEEQVHAYRWLAPVEVEPTDAEIAFWERAFCAAFTRNPYCSVGSAAMEASAAVAKRRELFGKR